jgi:hypothetical protein
VILSDIGSKEDMIGTLAPESERVVERASPKGQAAH